jgi:hypothetical protein
MKELVFIVKHNCCELYNLCHWNQMVEEEVIDQKEDGLDKEYRKVS